MTAEIKDILSELIAVSTNIFNEYGVPDNFDLEEFINTLEVYHDELDEIGEFYYYDNNESNDTFDDDDDFDNKYHKM